MNTTIRAEVFSCSMHDTDSLTRTLSFLHARGFFRHITTQRILDSFQNEVDSEDPKQIELSIEIAKASLSIEFREVPKILQELFEAETARMRNKEEYVFQVSELSEKGILFYFVHSAGDELVFIPLSEIVAIHTLRDQSLPSQSHTNHF